MLLVAVSCALRPLVLGLTLLALLSLLSGDDSNSLRVSQSLGFPALQR